MTAKHPNLLMNNRDFHRFLTDGIDVTTTKAGEEERTEKLWLLDPDQIENNDFLALNQYTVIEGWNNKHPDVVVFVNGLPVVVFELKNSSDENVGITEAYNQLQPYKATIPTLFQTNAFLVISDGLNARVGTLTASEEWYTMWRSMDGELMALKTMPQIEVLIRGMFHKETLLDIIRHFVLFQEDDQSLVKILAAYHQYYAVNKAMTQTGRAISEEGDRKIGVIWHTQGSGKSLSMVFYSGKLVLGTDNPTIVVLTDRN